MDEKARQVAHELRVHASALRNGIFMEQREATQEEQAHIQLLEDAFCCITGGPMPERRQLIKGSNGRQHISAGMLMHYASEPPYDTIVLHTVFLDAAHTVDQLTGRVAELVCEVGELATQLASKVGLVEHLERQFKWQRETFGNVQRVEGVFNHLEKEIIEFRLSDCQDPMELIDMIYLLFNIMAYLGVTGQGAAHLWITKQNTNEGRKWPDWRTADPTKAIEHIRDGDV